MDSDARTAEEIYNSGLDYLKTFDYSRATNEFKRVEDQYPYSVWVRQATIMTAWSYYLVNQYDESVVYLNRYLSLYPGTKESAYVYYLRAMCFYERIGEINRDTSFATQAEASFRQLINFYPDSIYARDSKLKLDLVMSVLGAKSLYLGRQALAKEEWLAALNRFREVVLRYNQTNSAPEALHRLVETYLTLGLKEEAHRAGALLGFNYPNSIWYKYTYALLQQKQNKRKGKNEKATNIGASARRG